MSSRLEISRAAPAVDALVVIAHDAEVAMLAGQRVDQLELGGVGVLVFIHHHVAVLGAAGFQRVGVLARRAAGSAGSDRRNPRRCRRAGRIRSGSGRVRPWRATLGSPNTAARSPPFLKRLSRLRIAAGSVFSPLAEICARIFLIGAELLGLVVDDEVALVAELLDVLAQDAHAERMEGADGWLRVES